MRIIAAVCFALIAFSVEAGVPSSVTPSLSGTWQGTLSAPLGPLRVVIELAQAARGWKALIYSLDQTPIPMTATAVSLTGRRLEIQAGSVSGLYQGTVGADGDSIHGRWTQVGSLPLDLQRVMPVASNPPPYTQRFVTVDQDVKLEVLDWGGSGRPVVLLTGIGLTAHVFTRFASKLTAWYHVYGITRRGFGASSAPATGYSAARLGTDVLAVIEALKIERPVLIGHSIAGEELSYVGSHSPQSVAGLVYLDAGGRHAFSDTAEPPALRDEVPVGIPAVERAILRGVERFTTIAAPILAIYADPHVVPLTVKVFDKASVEQQIAVLERNNPSARVVRIPNANHYLFTSNEAVVLREVHAFIDSLPAETAAH